MGTYISLGKFDKKYIYILFALIFINVFTTFYDIFYKKDDYKNSRIMSITLKHIGFSLCIIPETIIKKNSYVKVQSNYNTSLKKIILITTIAIIYLIHDFAFIFSDRYIIKEIGNDKDKKQFQLKGNFFYAFMVLFILSKFLFKYNYYKHQYISVILIICLGLIRYLAKFIHFKNTTKIIFRDIVVDIIFHVIIYTCLSFYISLSKIFMEKYFFSPWKTSLIVGLINLSSNLTLYFIFTFNSCEENIFCSLKYKDKNYIDNIFSFFSSYTISGIIIYYFCHLITSIRYILFNVILQNFTVFHILLSYQIVSFLWNIVGLFKSNKNNIFVNIIIVITYLIELFITFVFLEFFELNFCGLNKNLKKNIEERALLDSMDISNDNAIVEFEVEDEYLVQYNEQNSKDRKTIGLKKIKEQEDIKRQSVELKNIENN